MKKKQRNNLVIIICVANILLCILPTIITSCYTVLAGDDFSHANGVGYASKNFIEYVGASFAYAKEMYLTWQGTYFSMFMQALLSPLNNYGLPQLRVVMLLNSILFFSAVLFFSYSLNKIYEMKIGEGTALTYATWIYLITAYKPYQEIFFWFSGATSYSMPFSFGLYGLGAGILYQKDKKRVYLVGAIILGILAVGGSLTVAGTCCYLCLLLFGYSWLEKKRLDKGTTFIFCSWVIGALFNAAAPGNFIRQQKGSETGCHPFNALFMACEEYVERIFWFVKNSNFISILLLVLVVGIIVGRYKKVSKNYIIISVLAILLPIVTAFPVTLGYADGYYPDRCIFVADLAVILVFTNVVFIVGNYISNSLKKTEKIRNLVVGILVVFFICVGADDYRVSDSSNLHILKCLQNGIYQNYYVSCKEFYASLENREGEDVEVKWSELPGEVPTLYNFYLTQNPKGWENRAVSKYYNLSSIKIVSGD